MTKGHKEEDQPCSHQKSVCQLQIRNAVSPNLHPFVEASAQPVMLSRSSSSRLEGLVRRRWKAVYRLERGIRIESEVHVSVFERHRDRYSAVAWKHCVPKKFSTLNLEDLWKELHREYQLRWWWWCSNWFLDHDVLCLCSHPVACPHFSRASLHARLSCVSIYVPVINYWSVAGTLHAGSIIRSLQNQNKQPLKLWFY